MPKLAISFARDPIMLHGPRQPRGWQAFDGAAQRYAELRER